MRAICRIGTGTLLLKFKSMCRLLPVYFLKNTGRPREGGGTQRNNLTHDDTTRHTIQHPDTGVDNNALKLLNPLFACAETRFDSKICLIISNDSANLNLIQD